MSRRNFTPGFDELEPIIPKNGIAAGSVESIAASGMETFMVDSAQPEKTERDVPRKGGIFAGKYTTQRGQARKERL